MVQYNGCETKERFMSDDKAFEERREKVRKVKENLEPKLVAYMDSLHISDKGYPRAELDRFNCAAALLSYIRGYYDRIPFMDTFMGQYTVSDEMMDKFADPAFSPVPIIESQCSFLPGESGKWFSSLSSDDEIWHMLARN
jgi:hypothetical protein